MTDDPATVVAGVVARLHDAGAPTEHRVAMLRGRFGRERMRVVGRVWRLGALCLDADGGVFATGEVLIAGETTHPNFRSVVALERNELRGQLLRAGVPAGEPAVVGARPLDLAQPAPPLAALGAGVGVIWTVGASPVPLDRYLDDRAELLIHPPRGATD